MGNSIRTTSKNQNTPTLATFKAGDSVLCPSVGTGTYQLFNDKEYGCLGFTTNGKTYHYRTDGKVSRDDAAPSLFQDTPANRQAVATLYNGRFTAQANQRTVIDTTESNDDEVILISSMELSDTACDIDGAIGLLNDVGMLLWMIYQEKMTPSQAASMARLSHDSIDTWADLLSSRLNTINKSLAQSTFGNEVAA